MVISTDIEKFTYDGLEKQNKLLKTTNFGKIFKEFNDENNFNPGDKEHCNKIKSDLSISYPYDDISCKFCNVLYKIVVTVRNIQNAYFNGIHKDDKMYCLSLKYWLYEQLENSDTRGLNTNNHFQNVKEYLENKIKYSVPFPCTFNKLDTEEINKLRKIYAFALIYYSNLDAFKKNHHIECKFFDYMGKGLKEYYESLIKCSNEKKDHEFCKELNELQKIYKLDEVYWKNSTLDTGYIYDPDSTDDCPLVIESVQNPLRVKYREANNTLYLSNEPIDFPKSTIISASSAMGATFGISAFLLYLFKYTSFGSLFGTRGEKDNTMFLNVNEGTHDFTSPNSELEQTNFGNNEYKITYYSVDNS
ncbi:PIR Superfamily Protein [Plasmodium ovale wallikeri]|uniref:PIR Superfamily Protein n=1 Tax=Plasmodium ovale wallikeri TaxID=864142 RepID=A0A1A9ANX7_PLAOA|nr:PIR Superfamily Protein [Plasmodium ovale wallikeri]SBT59150.1 PIR Superfamily Protein [Plasmodium ovale wallikeri]